LRGSEIVSHRHEHMPKPFKFPDPNDYGRKDPAVLCPSERVLALYNQGNERQAKRIVKTVKSWFKQEAHTHGWVGIRFLPQVQTGHSAGAILWQAPRVQVNVTATTLVLIEGDDDADGEDE